MKKKILSVLSALLFSAGVLVSAYAAKCTTTITREDGTKVIAEVEGSSCTLDLNTGVCRCI